MKSWFIALPVSIIVAIIGYFIGGIIEDVMWMVGDRTIPECDKLVGEWQKLCRENNREYYSGRGLIQFFGFFIPLIAALIVFLKSL